MISSDGTIKSIGSFRNGNADVRLCVSCANFGSFKVTSLKPCVPCESSTVIAEIKVVLEVRRCWRISQSETFPGEGIRSSMYVQQTIHGWAASLVRESACKSQRAEECSTVKVGWFLRRTARCVALRKLPNKISLHPNQHCQTSPFPYEDTGVRIRISSAWQQWLRRLA